jgi:hypothetical protein
VYRQEQVLQPVQCILSLGMHRIKKLPKKAQIIKVPAAVVLFLLADFAIDLVVVV